MLYSSRVIADLAVRAMDPALGDERARARALAALQGITEGVEGTLAETARSGEPRGHAHVINAVYKAFQRAAGGASGDELIARLVDDLKLATRDELDYLRGVGRRVGAMLAALDIAALVAFGGRAASGGAFLAP